jgi:hypothetical protein
MCKERYGEVDKDNKNLNKSLLNVMMMCPANILQHSYVSLLRVFGHIKIMIV